MHLDDLVRQLPKQDRHAHAPKELRDNVEEGIVPVFDQRDEEAEASRLCVDVRHEMGTIGVNEGAEGSIKEEKRDRSGIEEGLLPQDVGGLGVKDHEEGGGRQYAVDLEEGDGFGPTSGDDQGILGIADHRVDVDDEKHHTAHHKEFLAFLVFDGEDCSANLTEPGTHHVAFSERDGGGGEERKGDKL